MKKGNFEKKKSADDKKHEKLPSMQKVNYQDKRTAENCP